MWSVMTVDAGKFTSDWTQYLVLPRPCRLSRPCRRAGFVGRHQVYALGEQRYADFHARGDAVAPCHMRGNAEEQRWPLRTVDGHGQRNVLAQRQTLGHRTGYRILAFSA